MTESTCQRPVPHRSRLPRARNLSACPFFDRSEIVCHVATHRFTPGNQDRSAYCLSDDYDDCPLYLCQALRRGCPQGGDRESLVLSGK